FVVRRACPSHITRCITIMAMELLRMSAKLQGSTRAVEAMRFPPSVRIFVTVAGQTFMLLATLRQVCFTEITARGLSPKLDFPWVWLIAMPASLKPAWDWLRETMTGMDFWTFLRLIS